LISRIPHSVPVAESANHERLHGYRPELDAVRFLAFFLVFLFHAVPFPAQSTNLNSWHLGIALVQLCANGLCLFFTLSAYLITDLLLTERHNNAAISVRKFYIRRVLRIWPLYFLGIAIGMLIATLIHRTSDVTGLGWYLIFAGNIYCIFFGWLANPMSLLWSISIEEQFYLLWPWAIRLLSRRGLAMCALVFIAGTNITLFILAQHHAVDTEVWANTFVQFEMFATGILLALAKKRFAERRAGAGYALVLAGPILWLIACVELDSKQPAGGFTAIGGLALMICFALIALGCASILQGFCILGPGRMPRWAVYLVKISFGLYVYHVLAIELARTLFDPARGLPYLAASGGLAFPLTVAVAMISYQYIESPFLRLKRRFEIVHSRPI